MLAALEGCALPPPASPAARQLAPPASEALTSALSHGNDATILVDGPATHKAMRAAIAQARDHGGARSRVWLTVGYFVPDAEAKDALIQAVRRGVQGMACTAVGIPAPEKILSIDVA